MKTNLVIATWSGKRRLKLEAMQEYYTDSALFLKKQIAYLKTTSHQLSQITFTIPKNPNEPKEFRDYLQKIPSQINHTPVVILERENIGLSYGSFSHAFGLYRDSFDYYIFLEDDYVFIEDNFDSTLVEMFKEIDNCGYLCGNVYIGSHYHTHPANFNGITTNKILSHLWTTCGGKLPFSNCTNYGKAESFGQVAYGIQLVKLGYKLGDLTSRYEVPFIWGNASITYPGKEKSKRILVPAQLATMPNIKFL